MNWDLRYAMELNDGERLLYRVDNEEWLRPYRAIHEQVPGKQHLQLVGFAHEPLFDTAEVSGDPSQPLAGFSGRGGSVYRAVKRDPATIPHIGVPSNFDKWPQFDRIKHPLVQLSHLNDGGRVQPLYMGPTALTLFAHPDISPGNWADIVTNGDRHLITLYNYDEGRQRKIAHSHEFNERGEPLLSTTPRVGYTPLEFTSPISNKDQHYVAVLRNGLTMSGWPRIHRGHPVAGVHYGELPPGMTQEFSKMQGTHDILPPHLRHLEGPLGELMGRRPQ